MKSSKELQKELNMDSLHAQRDKVLAYIEQELKKKNGSFNYYRHGLAIQPCTDPVVWNMVREELEKNGYTVSSGTNSHGVEYYTIHI